MRARLAFMMLGFGMGLTSAVVAVLLLMAVGPASVVAPSPAAQVELAPRCPRALVITAGAGCPALQAIRQLRMAEGRCPVTGAGGERFGVNDRLPFLGAPRLSPDRAPRKS